MNQYKLDIIKWAQELSLSREFIEDVEMKEHQDNLIDRTRFVLLKKIACDEKRTKHDVYIKVPSNWFQHLLKPIHP